MPPKRENKEFEKVKTGDFIMGVIEEIEYDIEHKFKYKGTEKTAYAIRIKFKLEGYEHPHRTRWMTFTYGEKSNLYTKYLLKLVEGAYPDMWFDIDELRGMNVKTIWAEKNNFQFIESIFPAGDKLKSDIQPKEKAPEEHEETAGEEEVPF